jgi:hypothetical protein
LSYLEHFAIIPLALMSQQSKAPRYYLDKLNSRLAKVSRKEF